MTDFHQRIVDLSPKKRALLALRLDRQLADAKEVGGPSTKSILSGVEGLRTGKQLVAYVVAERGQSPTVTDLRNFLKTKLPEYMLPSDFVFLDALPLTPNGKVDRKALPAPNGVRPDRKKIFVAPADPLELQLTEIWEKLLGVKPIGVKDNFFELGGHSLLAVRLFAQIEKMTGKHLPLATLFQAPTVEQLASILRQQRWERPWSSLVAIQPGGAKPPFFGVHAHEGNVLFYYDLARHLGPDQPFYGLQAQGLDGKKAPHARIEEMAAYYIREIRTLQPQGPYFLGGYCFGGIVAFEMAQQLHAQGERVALLALIDTYAPAYVKSLSKRTSVFDMAFRLLRKVALHLSNLATLRPKEKLRYIRGRIAWIAYRLYASVGLLPVSRARQQLLHAINQACMNYEPRLYPGGLTLFRAAKLPSGRDVDRELGWGKLAAREIEVHELPGYYGTAMLEPRVRLVAEELKRCLANGSAADEAARLLALKDLKDSERVRQSRLSSE